MPARIVRTPRANEDLFEHAAFIADDNPDAARRFLTAAEAALGRIADNPHIGRAETFDLPRLAGLRSWAVPGFRAVRVYYQVKADEVFVVRVLHGARDLPPLFEREADR